MNRIDRPQEINPPHFRKVMGQFATGVTVITASANGDFHGMTANAFMSGSLTPPLCVVSVAKRARMHGHLVEAGSFAVNILAVDQVDFANHFAGHLCPDLAFEIVDIAGIPALDGTAAHITADIVACHDCGDHSLFIGHMLTMLSYKKRPLLYHDGHYGKLATAQGEETPLPEFW